MFGRRHPTPDGAAVRDYVHVSDIADAHVLALKRLFASGEGGVFNLGAGSGASVLEVVAAAREATGCPIWIVDASPRLGDPAILIAEPRQAIAGLGWSPKRSALSTILRDAWSAYAEPNELGPAPIPKDRRSIPVQPRGD